MAFDEAVLDDPEALEALDSRGMLRALATSGAQIRRALVAAHEAGVDRLRPQDRPRAVLVAALGDSAVVGEVLDMLADPGSPVPLLCRQGGPLPAWVGPLDLVVAVSQSGRAPGPLRLVAEAGRRGAQVVTVGAADSPLAEASARGRGIHIPLGYPAPNSRTALWSLLTPVLVAADRLGVVRAGGDGLEATADLLDRCAQDLRPSSEAFVNPAKILASALADTVPLVLGDGPLAGVAAGRAAAMLSRSARVPTMHGALPDAAAQIVATFGGPLAAARSDDLFADPFLDGPAGTRLSLVMLRAGADDPMVDVAPQVARQAREARVVVHDIVAEGESALQRWAFLVARTDFAATYLALASGIDPGATPNVAALFPRGR